MSGIIKGIKKAFRKVVKVVKKIALPALAIGAVVLTGGAAIGALPSLGSMLGGLGLSPALTGVLATAAKGATMGAVTSAVTGGNIIKGATTGLIAGGAIGGIGAAMAPAASTAVTGTGIAGNAGNAAATVANGGQSYFNSTLGMIEGGAGAAGTAAASAPVALGGIGATQAAQVAAGTGTGGGILGFLNQNPVLTGSLIQGIGSGLSASAAAKDAQRERERIEASYSDMSGLYQAPPGLAVVGQDPATRFNAPVYGRVDYDPATGRIVPKQG